MARARESKVIVPASQPMVDLLGHRDELLGTIEAKFDSEIVVRGNEITITGDEEEAKAAKTVFEELISLLSQGRKLTSRDVEETIALVLSKEALPGEVLGDVILVHRGKPIGPKTLGQKRYVDAIRQRTVTFAIGPAGTGKTYLAMAMAVQALKSRAASRIILTRPAMEAGEKLGFLPGDLYEKVDPYFRPLWDALYDMMEVEKFRNLMHQGTIEVAPLAYMRGRTLNDSFIVLDEAQNTSPEQMKMFLTRLGFGSRVVVTGDVTQIDLPQGRYSGLKVIEKILAGLSDVSFIHLGAKDVVRHKLVQEIVEAYKKLDEEKDSGKLGR